MEKETLKRDIKNFLLNKDFTAGGTIEDYIRQEVGAKGETTSRILRFMMKDGTLENTYIPREKGRSYVAYKIKQSQPSFL